MKKLIIIAAGILLFAATANAQFGVKGGLNFNDIQNISKNWETTYHNRTGYHFGVLYLAKLHVLGLAVQPELLYTKTSVGVDVMYPLFGGLTENHEIYLDKLVLPVNLQIGLDLILLRPFIMVAPYVSYAIGKGGTLSGGGWNGIQRWQKGVDIGAGIDIWKLQITGKYGWDLDLSAAKYASEFLDYRRLKGFQLSVALLF